MPNGTESAELEQKLSHLQTRNTHKREKRAHEKIKYMQEAIQQLEQDMLEVQQELEREKKQSALYKSRWWRAKQKCQGYQLDHQKEEEMKEDKLQALEARIGNLEEMNLELNEHIHTGESKTIQCFRDGRFTDDMCDCYTVISPEKWNKGVLLMGVVNYS